mmetsp:Transcript_18918/g.27198  ORF Transcript_18918/g.27198 Transcript_18918/m.27198 type:complete len:224 (-) Transcript_18918:421-1092(-)
MVTRTIEALALWPTGNEHGDHYFFSLDLGRVINCTHATRLPMPDNVIDCIHSLTHQQQANPGLVFLDRDRQPILDDGLQDNISAADDSTYHDTDNANVTDNSSTNSSDSCYHTEDNSSVASNTSSSTTNDDRSATGYEPLPQQVNPEGTNEHHVPPDLPPAEDQPTETRPPEETEPSVAQPHEGEPNNMPSTPEQLPITYAVPPVRANITQVSTSHTRNDRQR